MITFFRKGTSKSRLVLYSEDHELVVDNSTYVRVGAMLTPALPPWKTGNNSTQPATPQTMEQLPTKLKNRGTKATGLGDRFIQRLPAGSKDHPVLARTEYFSTPAQLAFTLKKIIALFCYSQIPNAEPKNGCLSILLRKKRQKKRESKRRREDNGHMPTTRGPALMGDRGNPQRHRLRGSPAPEVAPSPADCQRSAQV